ncbi:MAG: hypothetical protein ACRYHA_08370 [Janthinobacterium lividum]
MESSVVENGIELNESCIAARQCAGARPPYDDALRRGSVIVIGTMSAARLSRITNGPVGAALY